MRAPNAFWYQKLLCTKCALVPTAHKTAVGSTGSYTNSIRDDGRPYRSLYRAGRWSGIPAPILYETESSQAYRPRDCVGRQSLKVVRFYAAKTTPAEGTESRPFDATKTMPADGAKSGRSYATTTTPADGIKSGPISARETTPADGTSSGPFYVTKTTPADGTRSGPLYATNHAR